MNRSLLGEETFIYAVFITAILSRQVLFRSYRWRRQRLTSTGRQL